MCLFIGVYQCAFVLSSVLVCVSLSGSRLDVYNRFLYEAFLYLIGLVSMCGFMGVFACVYVCVCVCVFLCLYLCREGCGVTM